MTRATARWALLMPFVLASLLGACLPASASAQIPLHADGLPAPVPDATCEWYGSISYVVRHQPNNPRGPSEALWQTRHVSTPGNGSCQTRYAAWAEEHTDFNEPTAVCTLGGPTISPGMRYKSDAAEAKNGDGAFLGIGIVGDDSTGWQPAVVASAPVWGAALTVYEYFACDGNSRTTVYPYHGISSARSDACAPYTPMAVNSQAFKLDCETTSGEYRYTVTGSFRRTVCDFSIDTDRGGTPDCAEYAKGTDPGRAGDDDGIPCGSACQPPDGNPGPSTPGPDQGAPGPSGPSSGPTGTDPGPPPLCRAAGHVDGVSANLELIGKSPGGKVLPVVGLGVSAFSAGCAAGDLPGVDTKTATLATGACAGLTTFSLTSAGAALVTSPTGVGGMVFGGLSALTSLIATVPCGYKPQPPAVAAGAASYKRIPSAAPLRVPVLRLPKGSPNGVRSSMRVIAQRTGALLGHAGALAECSKRAGLAAAAGATTWQKRQHGCAAANAAHVASDYRRQARNYLTMARRAQAAGLAKRKLDAAAIRSSLVPLPADVRGLLRSQGLTDSQIDGLESRLARRLQTSELARTVVEALRSATLKLGLKQAAAAHERLAAYHRKQQRTCCPSSSGS